MKFNTSDSAIKVRQLNKKNNVEYYEININNPIDKAHIEWSEPMVQHYSVWHPMCGRNRQIPQWFSAQKTESCFYKGAPVITTIASSGNNVVCVSLKDTISQTELGLYVDDFNEKYEVIFTVDIKPQNIPYKTILRIDRNADCFSKTIQNVSLWWNESSVKNVPDDAYKPLYSSWYNFHQNPEQSKFTEELAIASKLGFKTFILDDGWQIEGNGTKNYLKSGDWYVAKDKFPDFNKFVNDVHSFGMKFILWFSVPFAGYETKIYNRFKEKLLFKEDGYLFAGILDIRYPDVRKYITDTYLRFINDYDIDGLKLDFIDNFKCYQNSPEYNSDMDCKTVEDAVIILMNEVRESVCKLKPDFLFEFRQHYVGPTILEYGNMIRVGDCAFDSVTNRVGIADLRMMTSNIAVHSDMLLWSPDETVTNCAFQLLDVMFSAVQLSVLLKNSTPDQIKLIKTFLSYISLNENVLLKGLFLAKHPELNYTVLSSESTECNRKITVLYSNEIYNYSGMNEDIWNGTNDTYIVIVNKETKMIKITIKDFMGTVIDSYSTRSDTNLVKVPAAGMINIQ